MLPQHPRVTQLANTTYMQQQIANSTVRVATSPAPAALATPANGVLTRNPTEIGQNVVQQPGMKYVCCGGCRQWLLAPSSATLVHCAGCHSINNCALHQPLTPQTNANSSQR